MHASHNCDIVAKYYVVNQCVVSAAKMYVFLKSALYLRYEVSIACICNSKFMKNRGMVLDSHSICWANIYTILLSLLTIQINCQIMMN